MHPCYTPVPDQENANGFDLNSQQQDIQNSQKEIEKNAEFVSNLESFVRQTLWPMMEKKIFAQQQEKLKDLQLVQKLIKDFESIVRGAMPWIAYCEEYQVHHQGPDGETTRESLDMFGPYAPKQNNQQSSHFNDLLLKDL